METDSEVGDSGESMSQGLRGELRVLVRTQFEFKKRASECQSSEFRVA
jgi:hypothetical protein